MSSHADTIRALLPLWHVGGTQGDRLCAELDALQVERDTFAQVAGFHKRRADALRDALEGLVREVNGLDDPECRCHICMAISGAREALAGDAE